MRRAQLASEVRVRERVTDDAAVRRFVASQDRRIVAYRAAELTRWMTVR
ncbi:hypothetical protein [Micromonospora sp. LOL_024]